jgi:hypothetical protein
MNNKETLRKLIREEVRKELIKQVSNGSSINEGLLEKLLMALLSPKIKREVKKIKNDPEIKAAEENVKIAVEQWEMALDASIKASKDALEAERKARADYEKMHTRKNK